MMMGQNGQAGSAPVPTQPAPKASAAAPKLNNEVEMGHMPGAGSGSGDGAEAKENDIMHLARIGDIPGMEKLFETGEFDATYTDEEGITPLHWAAINNQYAMCKFLIDKGAPINAKGGDSVASPLQWAAQRCHYYTVHLLLQHGADPLATDAQGYNTLHISTFNGNVFLLVLLLHQGIPVDVADSFGHTSLMWSAYKGFPACVDVFLRWGASVHATDEQGFTALHWALVKGSPGCVQKVIEYGADRFAKTATGKTPAVTAQELNTVNVWHRALRECGYDEDGNTVMPASSWPYAKYLIKDRKLFVSRFLFFLPFVLIWGMIQILAHFPVYFAIPIAGIFGYGVQWVAKQVLQFAPSDMKQFQRTPWLAGIFAGSVWAVFVCWLFTVLPMTTFSADNDATQWLLNLVFAVFLGLTTFFYASCMVHDPGFVPKLNGIAEQKAVIDDLIGQWKFDEGNFCVTCMIRTPLRSKHCKRCQRCVARHDHHCPWVHNCVGNNNLRTFSLYLICLTIGIAAFDFLLYFYFTAEFRGTSGECNFLSPALCKLANYDSVALLTGVWATLQLTWVSMLIFVQFINVSRNVTTYENMFGIDHRSTGTSAFTSAFTSTGAPLDPNHPDAPQQQPPSGTAGHAEEAGGHGHGHGHGHKHGNVGFLKAWSRILGVDAFIETATGRTATGGVAGQGKRRAKKNPYSRGCVTNCRDFWFDPAPVFGTRDTGSGMLGGQPINWTEVYERPSLMTTGPRRGGYEAVAGEVV